jgi:hypothetical protein
MKHLLFLFLILSFAAKAQNCESGNCTNGYGTYRYSSGDVYIGEFDEDKRSGWGIYKWKNGSVYIGENVDDKFEGYGYIKFVSGNWYLGEFSNGLYEGEGKFVKKDGTIQEGLWKDDKFEGRMKYYGKEPGTTGCLNGDCNEGYGCKVYETGDRYFGYFHNGTLAGYGTYYWKSGDKYNGEFKDGNLSGFGVYYWANGEKYIGYWKEGKREDWGVDYYPSTEEKRIGMWKNDVFNKKKTEYLSTGEVKKCIDGTCEDGWGTYMYGNGFYVGNFKNGYRTGKGTYFWDSGDYYFGDWSENKRTGKGVFYFTRGGKFEGGFKNQYIHGKGEYMYNDGTHRLGFWKDGAFFSKDEAPAEEGGGNTNYASNNNNTNNTNTNNTNTNNNNTNTNNNNGFTTTNNNGYKEKRLALLIGECKYAGGESGCSPLKNSCKDGIDMAVALREMGFDVMQVSDGSYREMYEKINEFGDKLKNYTVGLFYYSGHGMQVDGNNYLIPIDAVIKGKEDVRFSCVDANRVLAKMEAAGTKANFVILDACRTNPFERSWSRDGSSPGLATMDAPVGTLIAYATSPNKTSSDGVGSNGMYTAQLLKFMRQKNMKVEDVFKSVRKAVVTESMNKQVPWESSSLIGDFYFAK